jgi:hypothetical protein
MLMMRMVSKEHLARRYYDQNQEAEAEAEERCCQEEGADRKPLEAAEEETDLMEEGGVEESDLLKTHREVLE